MKRNNITYKIAENLDNLLSKRQGTYTPAEYFTKGGTRYLFKTNWGPEGERECVVKVDKEKLTSPRAIRHNKRGCDTSNELKYIAGLKHQGIVTLYDYFSQEEAKKAGLSGAVSVEEYIPNSVSLEERTTRRGKDQISENEFTQIFTPILQAENYLINEEGVLHRDITPQNILVQEIISKADGKKIKDYFGKITDWANAIKIENIKPSFQPTAGGHITTDPLIMGPLTGKETSQYGEDSEVYAITTNMIYSIRGKPIFEYDPDSQRAIAWDTGESLLDEGRKIDIAAHENVLREALNKLPKEFKKYRDVFHKGLTLDSGVRYSRLEDMSRDFNIAKNKKGVFKRKVLPWILALGIGVSGLGLYLHNKKQNEKIEQTQEELAYQEKLNNLKRYLGTRYSKNIVETISENLISSWIDKLEDERTAFAAYLNPELTYEIVQRAGGETSFDSLRKHFSDQTIEERELLLDVISATEASVVDGWARSGAGMSGVIETKWNDAAKAYEEKIKTEQGEERRRLNRTNSATGFSPILYLPKEDSIDTNPLNEVIKGKTGPDLSRSKARKDTSKQ